MAKEFYEYDLITQLETTVDLYEQDRKIYWEEVELLIFITAEKFANLILKNTETLISIEEINAESKFLQKELGKVISRLSRK